MLVIYCPQLKRSRPEATEPDEFDDSPLVQIQRLVKALEAGAYNSNSAPTPEFMMEVPRRGLSPSEAMLVLRGIHVPDQDPMVSVPGSARMRTTKMTHTVYDGASSRLTLAEFDAAMAEEQATTFGPKGEVVDFSFMDMDYVKYTRDDAFQKLVELGWPTEHHERLSLENEERFTDYLPLTDPVAVL